MTHSYKVVCFLLGNSPASEFYMPTFRSTIFHLHRQVGVEWLVWETGYLYGKSFGSKIAWANGKEGDSVGLGPGTEQVMEGNDPNGSLTSITCSVPGPSRPPSRWLKLFSSQTISLIHTQLFSNQSLYTYLPMKMEETECSETSAYKIQTLGNYPEESI